MATEVIRFNGMTIRFCLNEGDTNGVLTMFECIIDAGARMPAPHYHKDFDESIYGVEGIVTYTIAGRQIEIGPGDSAFVSRGVIHGFENKTDKTIKFLAVINPGIFGPAYFSEIAEILHADGPPDIPRLKEVMLKHGLVPSMS